MWKVVAVCAVAMATIGVAAPASAQECRGESAMICGFVWDDANGNGIQDLGATGLDGKKVTLSDASDSVDTYTDQFGFFYFSDLSVGVYTLSIAPASIAANALPSPHDITDDALDSDGVLVGTNSSINVEVLTTIQKQDF